jgi:hypothetical protein
LACGAATLGIFTMPDVLMLVLIALAVLAPAAYAASCQHI